MATILLIEDDAQDRTFFQKILEEAGYQVISTGRAKEGLRLLRHQTVEIILVDILMPEMDGLEFILRLRSHQPIPKIIAMSGGSGNWDYLEVARCLGANDTLKKPLAPRELLAAVLAQLKSDQLHSNSNDREDG
jgi:DNA-binding response OmpR family regulator